MTGDDLTRPLRRAADELSLDGTVPLDAIHVRMRRLRRHRRLAIGGGSVVATVLVVVAGLTVAVGRPTSSAVNTASHGDPVGVTSPTTDPSAPGKVPSWSDVPPAPYPAPSADHYYKSSVVLTPGGDAASSRSALDLRVVAGFVADEGLIDRVAGRLDRSPTWVRRRIMADVDPDRHTLQVVAIDTDAEVTSALAAATAQALAHLASSPTDETYAAERQRVQSRREWLADQRRQLESRSDRVVLTYLTSQISELDDELTALTGEPKSWTLSVTSSGGTIEINKLGFQTRWNMVAAHAL
jgi:hypothetical protein